MLGFEISHLIHTYNTVKRRCNRTAGGAIVSLRSHFLFQGGKGAQYETTNIGCFRNVLVERERSENVMFDFLRTLKTFFVLQSRFGDKTS